MKRLTRKKLLSMLMTAALVISLLPGLTLPAKASHSYYIDYGSITVSQNALDTSKLDVTYYASSGALSSKDTIASSDSIVISGSTQAITDGANSTATGNSITVSGGPSEVNITLCSLRIYAFVDYSSICAISIGVGTTVNLTLIGSNILTSGLFCPGLSVPEGASLTITEDSTGSLTAIGGPYAAGIGSSNDAASGTVTIKGGTVSASSYQYGADIGGSSGILYVAGGSVNADFAWTVYQTSAKETAVYRTTVSGLPASTDMTCAYNGGAEFTCSTDSNGYLYLWLPSGDSSVSAIGGGHYYKAAGTIGTSNLNTLTAEECIGIYTTSLPVGIVSAAYSETLAAKGGSGSYSWSTSSSLPAGITLSADGVLSGTPSDSTVGSYSIDITVTDASVPSLTVTQTFTLTIYEGSGGGAYSLAAVASSAYTTGAADGNLPTMTVNTGVSGFKYFKVSICALSGHTGEETAVFVLTRGGQQIAVNATTADFDTVGSAQAGFNVKPGDVIEVYLVDSLTNSSGTSPTIL